jgi:CHAT domain-containing protein
LNLALDDVRRFGNRPELRAFVIESMAIAAGLNSDFKKSVRKIHQSRQLVAEHLSTVLPSMTTSVQQRYLQKTYSDGFHAALSLGLHQKDSPRAAFCSSDWLINGKALSQEVAAESALLSTPEATPLVQKLRTVRDAVSRLWSQDPEMSRQTSRERLAELESQEKTVQQKIMALSARSKLGQKWVTTGEIMSRLNEETVFVNVAKFRVRDLKQFKADGGKERYVAWVLPPAGLGSVEIVDLGSADEIESLVAEFKRQVELDGKSRSSLEFSGGDTNKRNDANVKKAAKRLSEAIVAPLESYIKKFKNLYVSPDGQLWNIPWDALITQDGKFLIESVQTTYIVSGRELGLQKDDAQQEWGKSAIFANPNFNLGVEQILKSTNSSGSRARAPTIAVFSELPGTAKEASWVAPSIEKFTQEKCRLYTWDRAQESFFKQLHRPKILVLSTHGFYTKLSAASVNEYSLQNPLVRCGLALAGANNRRKISVSDREDGVLTGLEIIGTDLRGTQLVVLSACQTGTGELNDGEGVAGLRQAFQLAGAKSVVSSLWNVADEETAILMREFFQELSLQDSAATAFRNAQLSRIEALRKRDGFASPYYWAPFTFSGIE